MKGIHKKRETPDKKVLGLYCDYLKNEEIVLEDIEKMMGFYECADFGTLANSILNYPNKEDFSNKTNPKWDNPFYSELKKSLEINMILLLSSTNKQKEKCGAYLYNDAFFWYSSSGNIELFEKTKNILNENNDIKIRFLEIIETHLDFDLKDSRDPFRFKFEQIELLYKLSKPPNHPEIIAKANGILDYIKSLRDNHFIEINKDDYC